jgi:raffinose/stachyose/melibiose transport system substrate-binding protein
MAKQFEAAHPGVKFEITPLENEAFKTKLTTVIQAGDPPDIFHTWGGGVLAQQADAGMVKDITAEVGGWRDTLIPTVLDAYTIEGKTYASAVDTGMVGALPSSITNVGRRLRESSSMDSSESLRAARTLLVSLRVISR